MVVDSNAVTRLQNYTINGVTSRNCATVAREFIN